MRLDAKTVQKALYFADYEPGPIDGALGPVSFAALDEWLQDIGKHMGAVLSPVSCRTTAVGRVCDALDVNPVEVAILFVNDAERYDEAYGLEVDFGPAVVELPQVPSGTEMHAEPEWAPPPGPYAKRRSGGWTWLFGGLLVGAVGTLAWRGR